MRPGATARFDELYRRRFQAVLAYVNRRESSAADAAEIVSDVFTVAWRRLEAVPEEPADLLWLYGTARRVLSEHRRRGWRRARLDARISSEAAPTDELDEDPLRDRVRSLIKKLRPADREVLRLVFWEDLTHEEAAQVLGCSVNAVAVRVHRARGRLAEQLATSSPEDPPDENALRPSPGSWRTSTS
jgi:RNA polymerase sigma factor (sigma-70 family)